MGLRTKAHWVGQLATTILLGLTAGANAENPLPQPEEYQQKLVDWIRADKNGFFHPAVVWKRLGPDGKSGPYAMHTTRDIPKGETLLVVPRHYTIDSIKTFDECVTIARMIDEYQKGEDSFYAPYLSYLFDGTTGGTTTGLLPAAWSERGKDILWFVLGDDDDSIDTLEPSEFDAFEDVFSKCGQHFRAQTNHGPPLQDPKLRQQVKDANFFHISRSWSDKMIPVLDMYNHRNGASKNVESKTVHHNDNDIVAYALRDIKAGEQLQNTYTECMDEDCKWGDIQYGYLTPGVMVDFGFVEQYPRRWEIGAPDQETIAEVDEDLETGEKIFRWIFDTPQPETIAWITEQLTRLREIEDTVRKRVSDHKKEYVGEPHHNIEHEADSILELYEGYLEVFEMALQHKDDPVGLTLEQYKTNLAAARAEAGYNEL